MQPMRARNEIKMYGSRNIFILILEREVDTNPFLQY